MSNPQVLRFGLLVGVAEMPELAGGGRKCLQTGRRLGRLRFARRRSSRHGCMPVRSCPCPVGSGRESEEVGRRQLLLETGAGSESGSSRRHG